MISFRTVKYRKKYFVCPLFFLFIIAEIKMKARNIYIRNNQALCITKYIYTWESNVRDALHASKRLIVGGTRVSLSAIGQYLVRRLAKFQSFTSNTVLSNYFPGTLYQPTNVNGPLKQEKLTSLLSMIYIYIYVYVLEHSLRLG